MASSEPTPRRGVTKGEVIDRMLRELQIRSEFAGAEADKRDRRLILRGMRIAAWALNAKLQNHEIADELTRELFRKPTPNPARI